ncbi:hypothetical protein GCM10027398_13160 [Azotobacter salinestris]
MEQLAAFKAGGRLSRIGPNKGGHWQVVEGHCRVTLRYPDLQAGSCSRAVGGGLGVGPDQGIDALGGDPGASQLAVQRQEQWRFALVERVP